MTYSSSELISYIVSIMGFLLFIVSLYTSKKCKAIKCSLALFLLIWSSVIFLGTSIYSGKIIYLIHFFRLDSPMHYLLGPTVYLFTLSTLNPNFKFKKVYLLHLLPFLFNFIEFIPFYLNTAEFKLNYYKNITNQGSVVLPLHYLFKTTSLFAYFVAQLFLFKKYQAKKNLSNNYQMSWFIFYFISQFILTTASIADHFSGLHFFGDPYKFAINMITFFMSSIIIGLLFFPSLLYGNIAIEKEIKEKYSYSKLSDEQKTTILSVLNEYMEQESKPFLNVKISMIEIAKNLKISSQQLSQVINEKTNLNFNDFVNTYRIEEAKNILLSNTYSKLTIDAIAHKSGFHSKSAFYVAFKKHTGNTPKEFVATASEEIPSTQLSQSLKL